MKAIIISQWDWCACERVRLFLQFTCSTTLGYASQINSSKSKVEINTHRILNGGIIAASWVSFTPMGNVVYLLTIIICKNLSFLWRTNSCWTTTSQSVRLKSRISKLISCEIAFMRFTYLFKWSWASTILLAKMLREERSKQYSFEYIFASIFSDSMPFKLQTEPTSSLGTSDGSFSFSLPFCCLVEESSIYRE